MATQPRHFVTPEEYLIRERLAETKSEYYQGEIFAMAGASEEHKLIATNLVISLGTSLRGRQCRVYSSDMRVLVSETGLYTYPDVLVVRGTPTLAEQTDDILTNPVLIVEVLSEATKDYDLGRKFHQYMHIPSLQEYLTVSQTEMLIHQHVRQPDNSWLIRELVPSNGKVPVQCLKVELDFADVYAQVEFPAITS
jgi:Uma2 family endonuclease